MEICLHRVVVESASRDKFIYITMYFWSYISVKIWWYTIMLVIPYYKPIDSRV